MAFEGLTGKIQQAFKNLSGKGKLSESDVKESMREVRMALLEADVNYAVAKDFIKRVTEKCVGQEVLASLTPAQQVIKVVQEEMTELMGGTISKLTWSSSVPTIYMLCGLQGAGKTTMAAKLAGYLIKQGKKPMLAACDIYRPAAIKQLQVVGQQVGAMVYEKGTQDPVKTAQEAVEQARYYGRDVLIIDTAGRLHIDVELMDELARIRDTVHPQEILLVVDAMTGQDAVNVANTFNEKLALDGVILTKLDGDTRGGAALSVRAVTGKPIKFSGIGEKLTEIEPFYPDRMASRILGMGDMLTLIEQSADIFSEEEAETMTQRIAKGQLNLEDFLSQMQNMKKMGGIRSMLDKLPGVNLGDVDVDEDAMKKPEAIIRAMTPQERRNPHILNGSRRKRIARGSGTTVQEVNQLLSRFEQAREMTRQMTSPGSRRQMMRMMRKRKG
ncbi:MAG: signal recognition particle protein [Clostridia bacterium]|nr:signal recognition particle protein [Clostridia bacterium]